MSVSIMNSVSGGGGISSDELTALAGDVLEGKTYVGNDTNNDKGIGTLKNTNLRLMAPNSFIYTDPGSALPLLGGKYVIAQLTYKNSQNHWDIYNSTFNFDGSSGVNVYIYSGGATYDNMNATCYLLIEKTNSNPVLKFGNSLGNNKDLSYSALIGFDTPYINIGRTSSNVKKIL